MKEEFDFDKIGKQMPYKVPSDFFDKITEETLTEAKRREQPANKANYILWHLMAVAASVVLLIAAGYFVYYNQQQQPGKTIAKATEQTPKEEQEPLAAIEEDSKLPEADKITEATEAAKPEKTSIAAVKPTSKPLDLGNVRETLDDVLASVSDEELLHLAAIADSDLYVYEQTID